MSYIYHSGYGYSTRLCKSVASWFINKYYPRHKITLDIIHRGMKREGCVGYCDTTGGWFRPRSFEIEIDTHEPSGVKSVNPNNLTWYLINAVKELAAEVEKLKNG